MILVDDEGMMCELVEHAVNIPKASAVSSASANSVDNDTFIKVFSFANKVSLNEVLEDKILNMSISKCGPKLNLVTSGLIQFSDEMVALPVATMLKNVFVSRPLIKMVDKDQLMMDVHKIRMSPVVHESFTRFIQSKLPLADVDTWKVLLQVWLRKILGNLLKAMHKLCRPVDVASGSSVSPEPLTNIDQNVLYHISGYLAMKLTSAGKQYEKFKCSISLINSLTTKEPQKFGSFVENYAKWVEKQTRGGLLIPST